MINFEARQIDDFSNQKVILAIFDETCSCVTDTDQERKSKNC